MDDDSSSRIAATLRDWMRSAPAGAQLPSTRAIAAEHQASPVTVQHALRALTAQGLIETRPGVGTFLRSTRTARPADHRWQTDALRSRPTTVPPLASALRSTPNDVIALHAGYPDRDLLPQRLVRAALGRATRSGAALSRPPAAGLPELQAWFAAELSSGSSHDVAGPGPHDVIVVPGSQSGLGSIFRAVVGPGRPILTESPTYWGAIRAAAQAGVRLVPIPTGPGGPDPDQLARAFEETGARAFYAQPHYANPTGAQWSPTLSARVMEVVRTHDAFLIEDDWAHDFGITTTPSPLAAHDDTGHVVYLRSLTKSVSPAVRVAAVVARGPVRARILSDQGAESMYVSGLLQSAALDVVTQPGWRTHLRGLREQLRSRRDLLAWSLAEHAPAAELEHLPAGGLNLWLRLPRAVDLDDLVVRCERSGLVVAPGDEWFPAEAPAPYVRLNYAGPSPESFPEAARILGAAMTP